MNKAQLEMIEAGGRTAHSFGLSRLFGQLYVLLYLSEEALNLDEIVERLGVSKASVSTCCRQLESWSAVRRVWKKGDRRDYYEAETNLGQILRSGLMDSLGRKLDYARIQIERGLEMLEQDDGNGTEAEFLKQRLEEAEQYRVRISNVLNNPIIRKLTSAAR